MYPDIFPGEIYIRQNRSPNIFLSSATYTGNPDGSPDRSVLVNLFLKLCIVQFLYYSSWKCVDKLTTGCCQPPLSIPALTLSNYC